MTDLAPGQAEEYTDALGQVLAGAVRLVDLAQDIGVPEALGLTSEQWAQRRLAGTVRLSIPERRQVVAELTKQGRSSREIGEALGVDHKTVVNDRHAGEDSPAEPGPEPARPPQPGEDSPAPPARDRSALFSSETGEWATPQDLFDELDAEFGFTLDVCATAENAKCEKFFAIEDDSLARPWSGVCWMNPPYGDGIGAWIAKAWSSTLDGRHTVVCLVPARTDTGWWWDYCRHGEIRFLRGRLRFGNAESSAPFPSALVVFPRESRVVWWDRGGA